MSGCCHPDAAAAPERDPARACAAPSMAARSGQSAIASLPSTMPSVSRVGEATDAGSMWSRPSASGPTTPSRTSSFRRRATRVALAETEPADSGGEPLQRNATARELDPGAQRVGADDLYDRVLATPEVGRIAAQHDPPKRPDAARQDRPHVGLDESGDLRRLGEAVRLGLRPQPVPVLEDDGAPGDGRGSRLRARAARRRPRRGRRALLGSASAASAAV